jgi:ribokinase
MDDDTSSSIETCAKQLLLISSRLSIVIITLGESGLVMAVKTTTGSTVISKKAFRITPVDTTGAGDTFVGYFMGELARKVNAFPQDSQWTPSEIESVLEPCLDLAICASAICCETKGAMNSIPERDTVVKRMKQQLD